MEEQSCFNGSHGFNGFHNGFNDLHSESRYLSASINSVKDALCSTGESVLVGQGDIKATVVGLKTDISDGAGHAVEAARDAGRYTGDVTRTESRHINEAVRDESRWLNSKIENAKDTASVESRFLSGKVDGTKDSVAFESRIINNELGNVRRDISDVKLNACKDTDSIKEKICDTSAAVQMKLCDISKDQWVIAKDAQLFAAEKHYQTMIEASKNAAAFALQSSTYFAAQQLEAAKNKCELEAKIAECCCETKMLFAQQAASILADGQKTRDVLFGNETQNLRDAVLAEKQKNALLEYKASLSK